MKGQTNFKILVLVLALVCIIVPANAVAAQPSGSLVTSIMQVIPAVGTFSGTLTTTSFEVVNGVINAVGTISGTLTGTNGVIGTITNVPITIPLSSISGTCTILTLQTGQIHLNI